MTFSEMFQLRSLIRTSGDGDYYSAEDLALVICGTHEPQRMLLELHKKNGILDYCFTCDSLRYSFIPNDTEKKGLAVTGDDLIEFISRLPGKNAALFLKRYSEHLEVKSSKEAFVLQNMKEWEKRGQQFKTVRKILDLSVAKVSQGIGVSGTRLSRFERGFPVQEARLIDRAYMNYLELCLIKSKRSALDSFVEPDKLFDMLKHPWRYDDEEEAYDDVA